MFQELNSKMFSCLDRNSKTGILNKEKITSLIYLVQKRIKKLYDSSYYDESDRENNILQEKINVLKCPKCGHSHLNKNGITYGRQRYLCKNCRTTFDERSFSPISNTKLSLEKWIKYCQLMIEGGSIRMCAREIDVSVQTSFFMRHRILDVMNLYLKNEVLDGLVEIEACYVNESFKGSRVENVLEEKYFRPFRIGRDVYNGFFFNRIPFIKDDMKDVKPNQICINTAIDRKGHMLIRIVDNDFGYTNNKIKPQNMLSFLKRSMAKDVLLCTFNINTHLYREPAQKLGIKIKNVPRARQPLYTVYNAYRCNWDLKQWLKNFNGVATKYLNNYLSWFKFLFISSEFTKFNQIKEMFMKFATGDLYLTQDMIKNRIVESL